MENLIFAVSNISKSFGDKNLFSNSNLKLYKGVHVFTGNNGCGKSSLLKILMGLTFPDKGDVLIFSGLLGRIEWTFLAY